MNILVTSAGRRVKVVQYLQKAVKSFNGKIITADCDKNAPALYFSDYYELVPQINDPNYISTILDICEKHEVKGVLSLIDPELEILALSRDKFDLKDIKLILSPLDMIQYCFDKQKTFHYLSSLGIPAVPTYNNLGQVRTLLKNNKLAFPLIIKPGKGSASIGLRIVHNEADLVNQFQKEEGLIIQPFFKDKEYGVDVYIDIISGELVDLFIKEKIKMRAGETDKSRSVHNREIEKLVLEFIAKSKFIGPIDIDCFEKDGKFYISEINPRFGGGYPHAYEMGCNFMEYIVNNLSGIVNNKYEGFKYQSDYVMMKYDDIILQKFSS